MWSKLLRGTNPVTWSAIMENMETRLVAGPPSNLSSLSKAFALQVPALK